MRRFRYGWGTFKVDWALSGPVPWLAPQGREAAVVHAGDSLADLVAFTPSFEVVGTWVAGQSVGSMGEASGVSH